MTEVRVVTAPSNGMEQYIGKVGTVIGVSGQYVKVTFEGDPYHHLFTPDELSQR